MRVHWDRNIVRRTLFKSPGAESRVPIYHYKKMSLFAVAPYDGCRREFRVFSVGENVDGLGLNPIRSQSCWSSLFS
jgi:hypothetical protein